MEARAAAEVAMGAEAEEEAVVVEARAAAEATIAEAETAVAAAAEEEEVEVEVVEVAVEEAADEAVEATPRQATPQAMTTLPAPAPPRCCRRQCVPSSRAARSLLLEPPLLRFRPRHERVLLAAPSRPLAVPLLRSRPWRVCALLADISLRIARRPPPPQCFRRQCVPDSHATRSPLLPFRPWHVPRLGTVCSRSPAPPPRLEVLRGRGRRRVRCLGRERPRH